jgi:hypothetical protein
VRLGKVRRAELPDIENISVQNKGFGLDGMKIVEQFGGFAAIGSQMNV